MTLRLVQEPQANHSPHGKLREGQMTPEQLALAFVRRSQRDTDTETLYTVFRRATEAIGGMDILAADLDFPPSYVSKISEGMARREKRRIQLEWLAPLLRHRPSARLIVEEICRIAGYEVPQLKREIESQELLDAIVAKLKKSGELGRAFLEQAALECGVDPETAFRTQTK